MGIVREVRNIVRQEDFNRNPVGIVTSKNADGTYAVKVRSRAGYLTITAVNASGAPIYVNTVMKLAKSTKRGRMEIVGKSSYKWKEPTVFNA
jgi:hypothetical protein